MTSSQEDRLHGPMLPDLRGVPARSFRTRGSKRLGVVNAWDDPAFKSAVETLGRRNLIMAGVTTDVASCIRPSRPWNTATRSRPSWTPRDRPFELSEALAQQRMRDAGVVLTATNTMIAELGYDWSRPGGMELLELLFTKVLPRSSRRRSGAARARAAQSLMQMLRCSV